MFILFRKRNPQTDGMGWAVARLESGELSRVAFTSKEFGFSVNKGAEIAGGIEQGRAWEITEEQFNAAPRIELPRDLTAQEIFERVGTAAGAAYEAEQASKDFDNR